MNNDNNNVGANRKYKDSVFTRLFGEKDKLAELYNAINGTNYTPDDINITTLQNTIFVGRVNDIAFTLGNRLIVLIEHQSSVNPNMPLRFLMYIARMYQELVDNEVMYGLRLVKILPPEFIVMYNGKDEYPEESTLKLSDAFVQKDAVNLELTVKVYNVNNGHNREIMEKSRTLNEYAVFVARVREKADSGLELMAALESTVKECVRDNVLRRFLSKYGSDVINMMNMEFNLEDAQKVWKNDGIIIGEEQKAEKIAEKMLKDGMTKEFAVRMTDLSIEQVNEIAAKIENMKRS